MKVGLRSVLFTFLSAYVRDNVPINYPAPALQNGSLFLLMLSHCNDDNRFVEGSKYLDLRCKDPLVDSLDYWKAHAKKFPNLSEVAKNLISLPGSSVAVERVFNFGRDVIDLRRHSLQPETWLMLGKSVFNH